MKKLIILFVIVLLCLSACGKSTDGDIADDNITDAEQNQIIQEDEIITDENDSEIEIETETEQSETPEDWVSGEINLDGLAELNDISIRIYDLAVTYAKVKANTFINANNGLVENTLLKSDEISLDGISGKVFEIEDYRTLKFVNYLKFGDPEPVQNLKIAYIVESVEESDDGSVKITIGENISFIYKSRMFIHGGDGQTSGTGHQHVLTFVYGTDTNLYTLEDAVVLNEEQVLDLYAVDYYDTETRQKWEEEQDQKLPLPERTPSKYTSEKVNDIKFTDFAINDFNPKVFETVGEYVKIRSLTIEWAFRYKDGRGTSLENPSLRPGVNDLEMFSDTIFANEDYRINQYNNFFKFVDILDTNEIRFSYGTESVTKLPDDSVKVLLTEEIYYDWFPNGGEELQDSGLGFVHELIFKYNQEKNIYILEKATVDETIIFGLYAFDFYDTEARQKWEEEQNKKLVPPPRAD